MTRQTVERRGNAGELESLLPLPSHSKLWLSLWGSPEALAGHVASMGKGESNWCCSAWTNSEGFTGSSSMKAALKMCRDGWPEGAARVETLRDKILAASPIERRYKRFSVAGAMPDVPRYLSGNPAHMRAIDSAANRRKPVLTLLSDMSANGSVGHAAITNRAAVVAAIIDAIEARGFACQVVTFECSSANGVAQIVAATVKESHAPCDVGRLAFGLGHASMFRRLSWAAFTEHEFTAPLGSGLGHVTALDMATANERGVYMLRTAGQNESAFRDENAAATQGLDWLVASLRSQGCPAFPADANGAAA